MDPVLQSKANIMGMTAEGVMKEQWPGMALVALVEIREAIEEGFARLDQTSIEAAMMLVGMKESFDTYLQRRLETEKVIEALTTAIGEKDEQTEESAEPKVDEPKKVSVTMDVGNFGGPGIDSGIA